MHLAAAQKVPIVSVWGPTRPAFFAPRADHQQILWQDYPCSPCVGMFTTFEGMWCNHEAWCMLEIEPGTVIEAVETMLTESPARRGQVKSADPDRTGQTK
jgi:ADP-heptose:LPS heptosyltransferase